MGDSRRIKLFFFISKQNENRFGLFSRWVVDSHSGQGNPGGLTVWNFLFSHIRRSDTNSATSVTRHKMFLELFVTNELIKTDLPLVTNGANMCVSVCATCSAQPLTETETSRCLHRPVNRELLLFQVETTDSHWPAALAATSCPSSTVTTGASTALVHTSVVAGQRVLWLTPAPKSKGNTLGSIKCCSSLTGKLSRR